MLKLENWMVPNRISTSYYKLVVTSLDLMYKDILVM